MSFVISQEHCCSSIVVLPFAKDIVNLDNIFAAVLYSQLLSNDTCFLVYHDEGAGGFTSLRETVEIAGRCSGAGEGCCAAGEQLSLVRIIYLGFTPTLANEIDYLVKMRQIIVHIFDCKVDSEQSYLNHVRHVKRRWRKDRCIAQQLADAFPALKLSKDMQRILQILHFFTFYEIDFKVWENDEIKLVVNYLMHGDCSSECDVMSEYVTEYVDSTVSMDGEADYSALDDAASSYVDTGSLIEENLSNENYMNDIEPVCTLADVGISKFAEKLIPFALLEWLLSKLQNNWNFLHDSNLTATIKMKYLIKHTNALIHSLQNALSETSQGFLCYFNSEQFIQNYRQLKEEIENNGVFSSVKLKSQCVQTFASLLCVIMNPNDHGSYFLPAAKEVMERKGCQYIVSFSSHAEQDEVIFLVKTFIERGNCLAVAKELERVALSTMTDKVLNQSWTSKTYGTSWRAGGLLTFDMLKNLCTNLKIIKRLQI